MCQDRPQRPISYPRAGDEVREKLFTSLSPAVTFALTLGISGDHAPSSPIFHIPVSKFA